MITSGPALTEGVRGQIHPWLRLGPCSPVACVAGPAAGAGPARLAARLLGALAVVLAGVPVALAARWAPAVKQREITMLWARLLLRALGVRLVITAPPQPATRSVGLVGAGLRG
ncbi:hypothetical protein HII36_54995, partial [Nonomuraea sp. NN258]|uniref:hypothetical protein n=1 Tax=Nonomuraea antri TaxID=2730852 RepID=UPI0038B3220F|nr:hypothetical protein [Nonomuraea antri]